MKQLTYIGNKRLEWRDIDEPVLKNPTDVIVRPLAAARCDGDKLFLFNNVTSLLRAGLALHVVDPIAKTMFGSKPFEAPFAVGHECVAEVVDCGSDVKNVERGDKVIVPWAISCGSCSHCLSDLTSRCQNAGETMISGFGFGDSLGPWGGMITDLFRVPHADFMLVKVPKGIDTVSLASASDNIPDAWRTVAPHLKKKPGAPVLIVGGAAASIGLYAAGIAVALDAERVDYLDYDPDRLDIAKSLGANPIKIPEQKRGKWFRQNAPKTTGQYPVVADCAMDSDGLNFAIRSLSAGGICTSVGYYFKKTSLPLLQMYANDSTFHTGISHPRATLPDVLDLIAGKKFNPSLVTTLLANWEEASEAFLERTTKVVVHRPSMFEKEV